VCPKAAASGGSPRTRIPLLFRTPNPTGNVAVPARPEILMITKTFTIKFRVKVFAIMKVTLLFAQRKSGPGPANLFSASLPAPPSETPSPIRLPNETVR
jgi:hypothetical protein